MTRPTRYPRNPDVSSAVDILQRAEDRLRESGDEAGAERVAIARNRAVDIALGVKRDRGAR